MARVYTSGFELNSTTGNVEWTTVAGSPSIQSSVVRSGSYALQISSLSSTTAKGTSFHFSASTNNGPFYFRTYFRYSTLPTAENAIIELNDQSTISTPYIAYVTIDETGVLRLYDEDGVIGSPSSSLAADTWYCIEVQFNRMGSSGSHIIRARLDHVEFAGADNRSIGAGVVSFGVGGNLRAETQTVGQWYFDDVAINDATGSFQNSYPGEGRVIHLRPSATGDNANWSRGGANSGSNFGQADEVTPNDNTDFLFSNTLNQTDDYNIDDTPAAMDSSDVINCVQVGVRFRGGGTANHHSFVLRIKAGSGGIVEESSDITPPNAGWVTNSGAVPRLFPLTIYDLPGPSTTPITKSDLDTMQIGQRVSATVTNSVNITAIWLIVDHKPATGTSVTANATSQSLSISLPTTTVVAKRNTTISVGVQTLSFNLPTVTAQAIRNTSVAVSTQNLTMSIPGSIVATTTNVIVSLNALSLIASLPPRTITTTRSVTVQPNALSLTASQPASNVSIKTTIALASKNLTISLLSVTIIAKRTVAVTVGIQSITVNQPSSTVLPTRNVTVAVPTQPATLAQPGATVQTVRNVTVIIPLLTAVFSQPSAAVSTNNNAAYASPTQSLAFTVLPATIQATRQVTVNAPILGVTLSLPATTITATRNVVTNAGVQHVTLAQQGASVTATKTVTITPLTISLVASIAPPTIRAGAVVSINSLRADFSQPTATVLARRNVTTQVEALVLQLSQLEVTVLARRHITINPDSLTILVSLPTTTVSIGSRGLYQRGNHLYTRTGDLYNRNMGGLYNKK